MAEDDGDGYYVNLAQEAREDENDGKEEETESRYIAQNGSFGRPRLDTEQTSARIGYVLEFRDAFAQPMVDIEMGRQTKTHETLDDETVTQVFGEKADRIGIQGVITSRQINDAKNLSDSFWGDVYEVRTEEWSGRATVKNVTITPRKDKWEGYWLYDVTIDLIEVTG